MAVKLVEEYWGGDDDEANADTEVTSDGQQFVFKPNDPKSGGSQFQF